MILAISLYFFLIPRSVSTFRSNEKYLHININNIPFKFPNFSLSLSPLSLSQPHCIPSKSLASSASSGTWLYLHNIFTDFALSTIPYSLSLFQSLSLSLSLSLSHLFLSLNLIAYLSNHWHHLHHPVCGCTYIIFSQILY